MLLTDKNESTGEKAVKFNPNNVQTCKWYRAVSTLSVGCNKTASGVFRNVVHRHYTDIVSAEISHGSTAHQ
jgi:hypothetical protein